MPVREDIDFFAEILSPCFPVSFSWVVFEDVFSEPVPGVFGTLEDDPKDAKAPDPRPKAEDAPTVGEDMTDVVIGVKALNGFALP